MIWRPSRDGGRTIQGKILSACFMTCSGVWMQVAAIVPTPTTMTASREMSAMRPAPRSTAPSSTALAASTSPMMLRIVHGRPLHAEAGEQLIDVSLA